MLNNDLLLESRGGDRLHIIYAFFSIFVLLFICCSRPVYAASGTVVNEDFVFDASIDEKVIQDGTGPFDARQEDGYDVSNHNGIVRTFDTVTYPLKITINPKKASSLKNIKLKITGSLENGVTDHNRVNAVFSLGNKTDIANNSVTFEQNYTVNQTGNSVMLPIAVEVKGATNGLKIRPNINVEVVSVDGVAVKDKVKVVLDDLPYVTVSGKVSVNSKMASNYTIPAGYLENGVNPLLSKDDLSMLSAHSIAFMGVPLKDQTTGSMKSTLVGSTFPDSDIRFHLEIGGEVYWDGGKRQTLDFASGYNQSPQLYGLYPVQNTRDQTHYAATPNTISEKVGTVRIDFNYASLNAGSKIGVDKYQTVSQYIRNSTVVDSGYFSVERGLVKDNKYVINARNDKFVITESFPTSRVSGNVAVYHSYEKPFSSYGFILETPNEYFPGYKKNPNKAANNVYYRIKVILDSYKDIHGNVIPFEKNAYDYTFTERNTAGNMKVEQSFRDINNHGLGSNSPLDASIAPGDSMIIRGQDVRVQGYAHSMTMFLGGAKQMLNWNTDSFEFTREYLKENDNFMHWHYFSAYGMWRSTDQKIDVLYGVPKNKSNDSIVLKSATYHDYTWYKTYDEAVSHGEIGAYMRDIHNSLGIGNFLDLNILLHVKTKRIGSMNEKGTYNLAFQKVYAYQTEDRSTETVVHNGAFTTPSIYDDLGNIKLLQIPVGTTVNFDTLGIVNGNLSTSVESDKNVYYSTDKITWNVENRAIMPSNVNFNEGEKVTFTQKIPNGLNYASGTYRLGDKAVEPKVTLNSDGSTVLNYDYYLSSSVKELPKIQFQTSINPLVLDGGNQQDLMVTSVIKDLDLDTRAEKFRTGTKTITIVKVGMLGVNSSFIPNSGKKNSQFTLRLQPYTTIDDEPNVRGVFQMPENKDNNGSTFSGSAYLKAIRTEIPKDKTLKIYVSDTRVNESNPNNIDVTKAPWKSVDLNGSNDAFKNAKTVYFEVQGTLAKSDVVILDFDIQTSGNNFGDLYFMKTSLNSDSNYKLSPESNKVRYEIVPDVALKFQGIRMYTDKASKGIKGNVTISKEIYDKKSNDKSVDLVIYDKTANKEVYRKTYTIGSIPDNLNFNVLPKDLTVNTHHHYEARFDRYDTDVIFVPNHYDKIDVDGYTSSELLLKSTNDAIKYKGVIMTERVIDQDMTYKYETLNVDALKNIKTKSGYGINVSQQLKVKYENDFEKAYDVKTALDIDKALASSELTYGDGMESMKRVKLTEQLSEGQFTYELPEVMVHKGDGKLAFVNEDNRSNIDWLNGGKQLYIPIWIKALQKYPIDFVSTNEVGINAVNFDSKAYVDVYAYMYEASRSESIANDELMLKPEMQKVK